jgi:hypothetical protein
MPSSSDSSSSSESESDLHKKKKKSKSKHKKKDKKKKHKKEKKKKKSKKSSSSSSSSSSKSSSSSSSSSRRVGNPISVDDYFMRAAEFRQWALQHKGVHTGELATKKAKKLFETFVERWNAGGLEKKYYEGMSQTGQEAKRTSYTWGFAANMDADEKMKSQMVRDSIDSITFKDQAGNMLTEANKRPEKRKHGGKGGDVKCYNCQGSGHMSGECPEPKREKRPRHR